MTPRLEASPCEQPVALRVFALGAFRLFVGERPIAPSAWRSHKAQLVLKYLLAREPERPVPADVLLEALWPEQDPALSGQCLRAAVSSLRRTLEPDLRPRMSSAYIHCRGGLYTLTLERGGFYDVAEFVRQEALAAALEQRRDEDGVAHAHRAAIALYAGDFLEDEPYAEWAISRRERLRDGYTAAVIRLGQFCLSHGEASETTDLAFRALETDAVSEPAYRLLIVSYARSRQWGRVAAVYERYRRAMHDHRLSDLLPLEAMLA